MMSLYPWRVFVAVHDDLSMDRAEYDALVLRAQR